MKLSELEPATQLAPDHLLYGVVPASGATPAFPRRISLDTLMGWINEQLLTQQTAFGKVVYVQKDGLDTTAEAGNPNRPAQTIGRAVALLPLGGLVVIGHGVYDEAVRDPHERGSAEAKVLVFHLLPGAEWRYSGRNTDTGALDLFNPFGNEPSKWASPVVVGTGQNVLSREGTGAGGTGFDVAFNLETIRSEVGTAWSGMQLEQVGKVESLAGKAIEFYRGNRIARVDLVVAWNGVALDLGAQLASGWGAYVEDVQEIHSHSSWAITGTSLGNNSKPCVLHGIGRIAGATGAIKVNRMPYLQANWVEALGTNNAHHAIELTTAAGTSHIKGASITCAGGGASAVHCSFTDSPATILMDNTLRSHGLSNVNDGLGAARDLEYAPLASPY